MAALRINAIILLMVCTTACNGGRLLRNSNRVQTSVGHLTISSSVDSEAAKYYLESYRKGLRADRNFDVEIEEIKYSLRESLENDKPLNRAIFCRSFDLASAIYGDLLAAATVQKEARLYPILSERISELNTIYNSNVQDADRAASYFTIKPLVVLVPGAFHTSNEELRDTLERFRKAATAIGIEMRIVDTDELGNFEGNVAKVRDTLLEVASRECPFIVMSLSRGAAEVQAALTEIHGFPALANLHTWISASGTPKGSPVVDRATRFPRVLPTAVMLRLKNLDGVDELRELSRAYLQPIAMKSNLPQSLRIICTVPISLSGSVTGSRKRSFRYLKKMGPNDGVGLCEDNLIRGALAIPTVGSDHNARNLDTVQMGIALIATAHELHLRDREAYSSPEPTMK